MFSSLYLSHRYYPPLPPPAIHRRWRTLVEQYLPLFEEREPLYHQYNPLWLEGVVLVSVSIICYIVMGFVSSMLLPGTPF